MTASPLPRKVIAAAAGLVLLGIAGSAGAVSERAASVRFSRFPRRLAPAELVTVGVAVNPVGKVCTLTIVYADAGVQALAPAVAVDGVARWRFHVLADAAPGPATIVSECGSAGTVRRNVPVAGSAIQAPI